MKTFRIIDMKSGEVEHRNATTAEDAIKALLVDLAGPNGDPGAEAEGRQLKAVDVTEGHHVVPVIFWRWADGTVHPRRKGSLRPGVPPEGEPVTRYTWASRDGAFGPFFDAQAEAEAALREHLEEQAAYREGYEDAP